MKIVSLVLAAATLIATPALVSAQTLSPVTTYGSIDYSLLDQGNANLGAVQARLGARFGPYVGIEGEIAGGVKADTITVGGTNYHIGLRDQAAAYGVAYWPISPKFDLLARIGYGNSDVHSAAPGVGGGSVNYGAGAQYFFNGKDGIRFDYTRYDFQHTGSTDSNVWSLGYTRRF